jgi:ATP phosphoribosyltransferase regulatory subunit
VARMEERLEAMARLGVSVGSLEFEGNYGRTSMEYYDGFVFGFYAAARPDLPAVATGGRYDALTRVLGQGRAVPAVGAVIRPDLVVQLRGQA